MAVSPYSRRCETPKSSRDLCLAMLRCGPRFRRHWHGKTAWPSMKEVDMVSFTRDPVEILRRFNAFVFGPEVPEGARDRLQTIPGSAADRICEGAELLYAWRDQLTQAGLTLLAEMYQYAKDEGWSAFCADGRCEKIVRAARGDLGEVKRPSLKSDPFPQSDRRGGYSWHPSATKGAG